MTAFQRRIKFKKDLAEHFHLNFAFSTHPLFPELDWLLLNYHLRKISDSHNVKLLAFVMMSTHVHLLFKSFHHAENYFTEALMKELKVHSDEVSLVEPIENMAQFLNCYKYIYRNPVEAGIITKCEDYRFSSLYSLLGKGEVLTPITDPLCVIQNPLKILNWLNDKTALLYAKKHETGQHQLKEFFQFKTELM